MNTNFIKRSLLAAVLSTTLPPAHALVFEAPLPGGDSLTGVLNTNLTLGAGIRLQDRSADLVGKANLNPALCSGPNGAYQSCQGLFKDQIFPAERLVSAPGAGSLNQDDGNLNFDQGDLFAAPLKVTSDLTLSYAGFGFFTRGLWFYDFVNESLKTYHPNRITADNYLAVGRESPASPSASDLDLTALLQDPNRAFTPLVSSRPWGQPGPTGGRLSYGRGAEVKNTLSDPEIRRQIGTDFQWLDAFVYGDFPLPGNRELNFKIGRQTINWGESTTLVLHSISQANPVNANNFYRIGYSLDEVFQPVNSVYATVGLTDSIALEIYYQLEWKNVEAPAPGSYFSDLDIGTSNAVNFVSASTGNLPEDPLQLATPLDSPLSGLSNTTSTLLRLPDHEPRRSGQFGVALKAYFENIGDGLDVGLYFQRYHSRLPIASFYATQASCARREGNALGVDANDFASFLSACPDIPFLHATTNPQQPEAQFATDSAAPLDSARLQLEYPEAIQLWGLSFNTTVGDFSIQGEIAFRPNDPLQIDVQDLAFAAFGPTLTRCHDSAVGCAGSAELAGMGQGYAADGTTTNYGSSDFTDAQGNTPYPDLINVGIGHVPGSARAFPSFVIPYRGGGVGENPPCESDLALSSYNRNLDCYIQGYVSLETYHFNFGTTQIFGPNNPLAADQIIVATEMGAMWVPGLPSLDELQFEAPGTHFHASAGADGSGADGSTLACSSNVACSVGPDGIRFNPHQQDPSSFADPLSWGYRIIAILSYENVLPGISLKPVLIWSHDMEGTSPGPAGDFVQGRKSANFLTEIRYKSALSFNVGYTAFTGGGSYNLLSDRDLAQFFVRYQF